MVWCWQGKTEVLEEKPVAVPLHPPWISRWLALPSERHSWTESIVNLAVVIIEQNHGIWFRLCSVAHCCEHSSTPFGLCTVLGKYELVKGALLHCVFLSFMHRLTFQNLVIFWKVWLHH
jgi:hypothetical protein